MDKIEIIKEKYNQLNNKMEFLMMVSTKVKLNFFTIKNHHFGNKWKIPKKYQNVYLRFLDQTLKNQE